MASDLRQRMELLAVRWKQRINAGLSGSGKRSTYQRLLSELESAMLPGAAPAPVVAPATACVKCGHSDLYRVWMKARPEPEYIWTGNPDQDRSEHLRWVCRACQYAWHTPTADAAAPLPVETPTAARSDCAKRDPLVPAAWCHLPEGHSGRCEFVFSTVVGPYRAPGPLPVDTDATPENALHSGSLGGEGDGGRPGRPAGNGDAPRAAASMPRHGTPGTPTAEGSSSTSTPPAPAPLDDGGAKIPRLCPACESPEKWGDQHAPWCPRALDDGETGGAPDVHAIDRAIAEDDAAFGRKGGR
jgi:hypothetical protein